MLLVNRYSGLLDLHGESYPLYKARIFVLFNPFASIPTLNLHLPDEPCPSVPLQLCIFLFKIFKT